MKRVMNKKVVAAAATVALTLGLAGAALAYFTATGAGNGTATVGSTGNNIAIEGNSTPALYPGESTTMSFTAYNYSPFNQAISGIHVTGIQACSVPFSAVSTVSYTSATTAPTCSDTNPSPAYTNDVACQTGAVSSTAGTGWFSMPDVTTGWTHASGATGDLPPGSATSPTGVALTPTGTITMNDQNANQNACEGLYLNFTFTTS